MIFVGLYGYVRLCLRIMLWNGLKRLYDAQTFQQQSLLVSSWIRLAADVGWQLALGMCKYLLNGVWNTSHIMAPWLFFNLRSKKATGSSSRAFPYQLLVWHRHRCLKRTTESSMSRANKIQLLQNASANIHLVDIDVRKEPAWQYPLYRMYTECLIAFWHSLLWNTSWFCRLTSKKAGRRIEIIELPLCCHKAAALRHTRPPASLRC